MKRTLALFLALCLFASMTACSVKDGLVSDKANNTTKPAATTSAKSTSGTEKPAESDDMDSSAPSVAGDYTGALVMAGNTVYRVTDEKLDKSDLGREIGKVETVTDATPIRDGEAKGLTMGMKLYALANEDEIDDTTMREAIVVENKGVYYRAERVDTLETGDTGSSMAPGSDTSESNADSSAASDTSASSKAQ